MNRTSGSGAKVRPKVEATPEMRLQILTAALRDCIQAGIRIALAPGDPGTVALTISGVVLAERDGGVAIEPAPKPKPEPAPA